jgi:hypothetical protein
VLLGKEIYVLVVQRVLSLIMLEYAKQLVHFAKHLMPSMEHVQVALQVIKFKEIIVLYQMQLKEIHIVKLSTQTAFVKNVLTDIT